METKSQARVRLPGTESESKGEQSSLHIDLAEVISALIVLRSRRTDEELHAAVKSLLAQQPLSRNFLTAEQYIEQYGAPSRAYEKVLSFAKKEGFEVQEKTPGMTLQISGPLTLFQSVFHIKFSTVTRDTQVLRVYSGHIHVPDAMSEYIDTVMGLETPPQVFHHAHASAPHLFTTSFPEGSTEATKVARIYQLPQPDTLHRQCIGIVELGGGFFKEDMEVHFKSRNLPLPHIRVAGAGNRPAPRQTVLDYLAGKVNDEQAQWTVETTLDIQLAGSFAPNVNIAVYFEEASSKGEYQGVLSALTDVKNRPSVLSCSWGSLESEVGKNWANRFNRLLMGAALLGITVCFSTGDLWPSSELNFPSTSPYALACGGTHLSVDGAREAVWDEIFRGVHLTSVGGASTLFREPSWQSSAKVEKKTRKSGRGVPDVAGKADLVGGYAMTIANTKVAMGGTSAAAPLWAALAIILNDALDARVGFFAPDIYKLPFEGVTRDTRVGTNGAYQASLGWDPCTGLGSPLGSNLLDAFQSFRSRAAAG